MIYFIYGKDTFRAKRKLSEIVEGYKKVHKSGLNLIYMDAKEKNFSDFFNVFKIVSMFAEKKLVILKNVFLSSNFTEDFLKNIEVIKGLKDIVVVLEDGMPDQRVKIFKALQKFAKCQEFDFLPPAQLSKWVLAQFAEKGAKINNEAQNLLLEFVGSDLWRMENEIKKLFHYKNGKIIEKQDVELLIRPNIENDIFKTIDALAAKNKKLALELLHKHLENGDNSLYLLSMIAYQFRNFLIIKELSQNHPYPIVAAKSGLHPFVVKKSYYLCNQFSFEQLKKIYLKIFQIDSDIKTGKINAELALDMLVSEI